MRRRPSAQTALLSSFVLALVALPALATVSIDNVSHGVSVSPPGTLTLVVRVTNTGSIPDTFAVHSMPPHRWSEIDLGTDVQVSAGASETVLLVLRCPAGTPAGVYEVPLQAISLVNPSVTSEAFQTVTVLAVAGVHLAVGVQDQGALPGDLVVYPLVIYNCGNSRAEFELSAFSPAAPTVEIVPAFLDIPPGGQAKAVARQAISAEATPGDLVRMALTVTARLDRQVSDSAVLTTEVLPPPPDAVGGSLMQHLPAIVRFAVGEDVFSGQVSGDVGLSFAGDVEDGSLSVDLGVRSWFGPSPLEVHSVSILYRRDMTSFAIGDTAKHLTDLVGISCRGGVLEIDAENYGLMFVGGGLRRETRAGGRLVIGPEALNVGLAYVDSRSAGDAESIWSLAVATRPFDVVSLQLEGALGEHNSVASQGLLLASQVDAGPFYLDVKVLSVGTEFPGAHGDSAGILIAQRLHLPELTLGGSFAHTWDDTSASPLVERTIRERLELDASGTPVLDGPSLRGEFGLLWDHGENPTWKDLARLRLAFAARGGIGAFPYNLSAERVDRIDHVLGASTRDVTIVAGCGMTFDSYSLGLTLIHRQAKDLITEVVTDASTSVAFRFDSSGAPCTVELNLGNTGNQFDAGLSLALRLADGLDFTLATTTGWDRAASSQLELGWSTTLNYQLNLPLPFLLSKGRLAGRVFVDANGNGRSDPGEIGLGNVVLVLDGTRALTGADGRFRFSPLPPGSYSLRVANIPLDYVSPTLAATRAELEAGGTADVSLPVVKAASLRGRVDVVPAPSSSEAGSGLILAGEGQTTTVLAGIAITLESKDGEALRTVSNAAGEFHFDRLRPGEWTIRVARDELPRFHSLPEEETVVRLAAGERAEVGVNVLVEQRPVEVIEGGTLY